MSETFCNSRIVRNNANEKVFINYFQILQNSHTVVVLDVCQKNNVLL